MALSATCPHCSAQFRADDKFAQRIAKCPKCTKPFQLPALPATPVAAPTPARSTPAAASPRASSAVPPPAVPREELAKQILAAFTGPIRKPRTPVAYQLAAIVVALLMVLLPVIYLGLIAAAGYGVYYHAVNHTGLFASGAIRNGKALVAAFLIYLAPLVAGGVLVIFMIKPLFARSAGGQRSRSLRREAEPLLFAFVDRICETVGAPRPRQIDVDCDVNASARFRRGLLSMFGRDLVLTIGMPLVAGLNARQFAGVLAHEFGHFSQGFGMRLTYLIRSLNSWFARVVYQRDQADAWLEQTAAEVDIRLGWILYLAMGFVWLSRRILWVLMYVGHFFGSFLLRQMEFDADRYEARLAGSVTFEQTARRLRLLAAASNAAFGDLREFYREGRLGDDLPQLIMARAAQVPPDVLQAIDREISLTKTGMFDTHPCDLDRIAAAQKENADGVFRLEQPASVLLTDFEAQSKAATWEFYRGVFGDKLERSQLRPVTDILAKHQRARAAESALERFFQGEWSALVPLPLNNFHLAPPENAAETLHQLKAARQEMAARLPVIRGAAGALYNAHHKIVESQQIASLLRANVKIPKATLSAVGGADGVKRTAAAAAHDGEQAAAQLAGYGQLAAQRIMLALQLLYVPKVVERLAEPRPQLAQLGKLVDAMQSLVSPLQEIAAINPQYAALHALVQLLQGGGAKEDLVDALQGHMEKLLPRAKAARSAMERCDYPYEHAGGKLSLAQFVMPDVPAKDDLGSIYNACGQLVDAGPALYVRILGELAGAAEASEKACGLPPLAAAPSETAAK